MAKYRKSMDDNILSLIQGCLANDNASWNVILQICASITLNHHRKHFTSLSPDDTDFIVSNVYTKLLAGGLGRFSGRTKYELLSYFKTIVKNETFSFFRQHAKRNRDVSLDQDLDYDGEEDTTLYNQLPDNNQRPDSIAEINDLFLRAMCQLSIRDKQILLYKIEGYKDKEIAELLCIPPNTVASGYSRLKAMLQRNLVMAILIILTGRNWPWSSS